MNARRLFTVPLVTAALLAAAPLASAEREERVVMVTYLAGESREVRMFAAAAEQELRPIHDSYFIRNEIASLPMIFTPLPDESPFSPHDQHQMAYWNVYQPDLFQVGPPTGIWDYGNGVSEIGFPDDARLQAEFGFDWMGGAHSAIGWRTQNGHIVEADIALNPALSWTLNEDEATRPNGPESFRRTILGYLGEAWGMRVPFFVHNLDIYESVVTFTPPEYRLATLFADDTAAVRAAFGGAPIRDGLISSYFAQPSNLLHPNYTPSRPSVSSVRPGGSFKLMSPIKIENPGTEDLVNPRVEVYLVPQRFSMEGAVFLRRIRFRGTVPAGAIRGVVIGRAPVPRTVPPGIYYLAFRLLAAGDEVPANDLAWSNYNVTLTVKAK